MAELSKHHNGAISPKILCVDDEHAILSSLRRVFRREGYHIMTASSSAEALTVLENTSIDLLISDMHMPQISGDKLLSETAKRWQRPFICAERHPAWGAEQIQAKHASEKVVWLVANHQTAPDTFPPNYEEDYKILIAADNRH